jgi:hypothetical protein
MDEPPKSPLHPGTILGAVVLVVALAGSVYGASTTGSATIGSAQIKDGSIKLADISPRARKALRGARGPAGLPGVAAAGAAGPAGPPGAPGTARAYGYVSADGTLDPARSKNLTATKLPEVGIYCVTPTAASGVTRSTAFPVVSADFNGGPALTFFHLAQFFSVAQPGCPNGWQVIMANFSTLTKSFDQTNLAFSVVIP